MSKISSKKRHSIVCRKCYEKKVIVQDVENSYEKNVIVQYIKNFIKIKSYYSTLKIFMKKSHSIVCRKGYRQKK